MQDLVVLVADKNMQFALQGALARPQALGVRPFTFAFRSHMGRDGGVRTTGADVLALETTRAGVVVCGPGNTLDSLSLSLSLQSPLHT